jgi:hypothetical protein
MNPQNKYALTIGLLICILIPSLLNVQPSFDDSVSDVPIDGGLSLLIAGGIGYGLKKLKKNDVKKQ